MRMKLGGFDEFEEDMKEAGTPKDPSPRCAGGEPIAGVDAVA
jgi:hypothetical protein